jgi:hypothetical protein
MNIKDVIFVIALPLITISAEADNFERKVLLENFTTADCINCPNGHKAIENALSGIENVIWVCHHAGYTVKNDPYQIDPSIDYTWFYDENGAYAPAVMIDRHNFSTDLPNLVSVSTPVMSITQATVSHCSQNRLDKEATISVNINKEFNTATHNLKITVSGLTSEHFNLKNPTLSIFITEDSLISYQNGGGSKYRHDHVIREVVTQTWGDSLIFSSGAYSKDYTIEVPETWKYNNVRIIAFVANYNSKDKNDCSVENANITSLLSDNTSGIDCINNTDQDLYDIFSIDGRFVTRMSSLSTNNILPHGIYILRHDGHCRKIRF